MTRQTISKGQNGFTLINDTSAHTPPDNSNFFSVIQAVGAANAVINNTGTTVSNAVDFDANITLASGETLDGQFSQITLVSGAVVAYHD